jgi:hypothetical protein
MDAAMKAPRAFHSHGIVPSIETSDTRHHRRPTQGCERAQGIVAGHAAIENQQTMQAPRAFPGMGRVFPIWNRTIVTVV